MECLNFINALDPKLGPTLTIKPYWEIAKSVVESSEVKEIERGYDTVTFIRALYRRGNYTSVVRILFKPVQTTSCCSTISMFGYDTAGRVITQVNFNLRKTQKVI